MTTLGPAEAFEVFLPAMERFELDAFYKMFDDDIVMRFPYMSDPYPKLVEGRAACEEFFTIVPKLFSEFRWVEPRTYTTDDSELAITVTKSAAKLSDGTPYDNDYVLFLRVRNGKVLEYREHFDPARALAAFQTIDA